MSVDIVIPLGVGSLWQDNELRFCLRSISKYLTDYGQIFIIGDCPDFIQNIIHIPATDSIFRKDKDRNIFNKLMIACEQNEISESFLFMNDDHYLLSDLVASEIPYYYREEDMIRTIQNNQRDIPCTLR